MDAPLRSAQLPLPLPRNLNSQCNFSTTNETALICEGGEGGDRPTGIARSIWALAHDSWAARAKSDRLSEKHIQDWLKE